MGRLCLIFLSVLVLLTGPVGAAEPFRLPQPPGQDSLARRVEALRDPGRAMTLAEAMASDAIAPLATRSADFGYTHDHIWLRLAERKDRRIADTVHDLRQPLHALRMNIRALGAGRRAEPGAQGRIEEMFTCLENLVGQELAGDPAITAVAPDPGGQTAARADLRQVIAGVVAMFEPEAAQKGLRLRAVPSRAVVALPPIEVMRAAANLVSNAIKYTERGGVLIGVRHRDGVPWLEVHDTGIGMRPQAFRSACARAARLPDGAAISEGSGLGLAIVSRLARDHGLRFEMTPCASGGSRIAL